MGYFNNNLGYGKDLLASRAIIKRGNYALIPPDGLVCNVIPGFENCNITVLATPKLGASFVDYLVTLLDGGKNAQGFGGDGIETFVYVISGKIKASADGKNFDLATGGYLYCPAGTMMHLENDNGGKNSQLFLYKRRYIPLENHQPYIISDNVKNLEKIEYEGMKDVILQDLLPKELAFDMNIHILSFNPGASHGYIETHLQEHGAYILSGEGMYNLDNDWIPVKKGDYIFMGAYCLQACYAVGRDEPLSYIYSKDCHRDIEL
jgi:(S)-ureidoglycine aminohydrolase